jgi:Cytochrome c3
MRAFVPISFIAWLLLCLAAPAGASDEATAQGAGGVPPAADEGGFGDDAFSLAPVDLDLPNKIRKWNAECYSCHSLEGVHHPPRPGLDLQRLASLEVDSARYDQGVHTGMACKECHIEGYVAYPHAEQAQRKIKPCIECHRQSGSDIEKEFKLSVHYKKHGELFTCTSCHSPHYMRVAEKIRLPRAIADQDNHFCMRCHQSESRYSQFVQVKELPDLYQVHAWLPNVLLHWATVRCIDCHTPAPRPGVGVSHDILPKDKSERECVSCHSRESSLRTRLYRYLVHEDRLEKVGFLNAYVLNEAYVVGATRNEWLDRATFLLVGLMVAGIALHAALRAITAALRRRRRHV